MTQRLLLALVLTLLGCGTANEGDKKESQACLCRVLEDFRLAKGRTLDIDANTDKKNVLEGDDREVEFYFNAKTKEAKIKFPTIRNARRVYRELSYDGSKQNFVESVFIVEWCDIWFAHHEEDSCSIPSTDLAAYELKRDSLFTKFASLFFPAQETTSNEETEDIPQEPINDQREKKPQKPVCRDTLIKASNFKIDSIKIVRVNDIVVSPLSNNRYLFCYVPGDLLEVLSSKNKLIRITL